MRSSRRPGRGDEDVDAAAQGLLLRRLADAAEDDGATSAAGCGRRRAKLSRDLDRQLARRGEDQDAAAARGPAGRRSAARRCRIGSANAAVLPVPVWAMPSRSRPSSTCGIACAWIGVGVV